MAKTPNKKAQEETPIPFDEALKRVWSSPPQPKKTKKNKAKNRSRSKGSTVL